jgi:glucan phosphoethanolaminetransferase (alkaline phosphatase superfamily)
MADWAKTAWRAGTTRVSWLGLVVPWAVFVLIFWAQLNRHISLPLKPPMEVLALIVCYAAVVIALARYLKVREPFFLWLLLLCVVFTLREHHFPHTGNGVFIGSGILALYAWFRRSRLQPFLDSRPIMTMPTATIMTYYIAWSLDARMWRRWLPGDKVTTWSPVEETMEVVGHGSLLLTVIVAMLWARRRNASTRQNCK